jgi:hypothetical protein
VLGVALGAAAVGFAPDVLERGLASQRLQPLSPLPAWNQAALGTASWLIARSEEAPLTIEVRDATGARRLRIGLEELVTRELTRAEAVCAEPTERPAGLTGPPPWSGGMNTRVAPRW